MDCTQIYSQENLWMKSYIFDCWEAVLVSLEMVLWSLVSKSLSGFPTTVSTKMCRLLRRYLHRASQDVGDPKNDHFQMVEIVYPLHSPCPQFFFILRGFNFKQPLGGTARRPVVYCAMAVQHGEPFPTAAGTRTLQPRLNLVAGHGQLQKIRNRWW